VLKVKIGMDGTALPLLVVSMKLGVVLPPNLAQTFTINGG